jgi:hypothetical protein
MPRSPVPQGRPGFGIDGRPKGDGNRGLGYSARARRACTGDRSGATLERGGSSRARSDRSGRRIQSPRRTARQRVRRTPIYALGVIRNRPGGFAALAFHPPVVPARAVPNLQDGPEESRIARVTVLALTRVAEGGRGHRVEPNTTVGDMLVVILGPTYADRPPMSVLELTPFDRNGGIGRLAATRGIIVRTTPSGAAG